jgi:hypothetical protein
MSLSSLNMNNSSYDSNSSKHIIKLPKLNSNNYVQWKIDIDLFFNSINIESGMYKEQLEDYESLYKIYNRLNNNSMTELVGLFKTKINTTGNTNIAATNVAPTTPATNTRSRSNSLNSLSSSSTSTSN